MKLINQNLTGKICTTLVLSAVLSACGDPITNSENLPPAPTLQVNNIQVTEGNSGTTIATFNVTLSDSSTNTVTVDYATSDITATTPGDYQSKSATLSFLPGETNKTVTINVVTDVVTEPDETFRLTLSNPDNASLSDDAVGLATITNDDGGGAILPALQIGNINITEGNSGLAMAEFIVTLSTSSTNTVTIDYATSDVTATAPSDYQSKNATLSFAPGETAKTVTVNIVGDTVPEPDETFRLTLSNPNNADLSNAVGLATITNDDDVAILPALQVGDITITEGNSGTTTATFSVTLSTSSVNTVTVDYATSDITATAPGDYQSKSATLSFAPGETNKTVTVNVVTDVLAELDETFRLTLSNPDGASLSNAVGLATITNDDTDSTILLSNPGPQSFNEEQEYTIDITARPGSRVFVSGMPPGMHWDEVNRRFDFHPDFTQGGKSWPITMEALDGAESDTQIFMVTVNNTIQPPWPVFVKKEPLRRFDKLTVRQVTDDFLDSPNFAGREFEATLAIPAAASVANLFPVRIGLHAFGGSPGTGNSSFFGISPHDPYNTWWTGYNDELSGDQPSGSKTVTTGTNPNYTQRRVMHLLSYLLENCPGLEGGCPGADPERVSVSGQSMGGTGSFFLAINYSYHFSEILPRIGGTTPYFLSPGHQDGLTRFWGAEDLGLPSDNKGTNTWHRYDSSRAVRDNKDFRNIHFSIVSGKNDPTIQFTAMVGISPVMVEGKSFLATLQDDGIGHLSVWDQRGHSGSDPSLGAVWWSPLDKISFLSRNLAFPAFSNGSTDDDAGEPDGMGEYTGTLRGTNNRYLRWDSANIIDTRNELSMPLKVDIDTTGTAPADPTLPPRGNQYYGPLPITTDVTIRRIQQFQMLPEETINWNYNGKSGTVLANDDGSVTVRNLEMTTSFTPLVFTRP